MKKRMNVLLIEDDATECQRFMSAANDKFNDYVTISHVTNSSKEGIELAREHMFDGVILDLELHKGEGSGLDFLKEIDKIKKRPIIIIATNTPSEVVYNLTRVRGSDFIHYKRQKGYTPEIAISTIIDLWWAQDGVNVPLYEEPQGQAYMKSENSEELRIRDEINKELDLLGVSIRHKGRAYVEEAVYILLSKGLSDTVFYQVAEQSKVTYSTVIRAIQTVITKTWNGTKPEILTKYYTAHIDIRVGVPSPTEFVRFFYDKIRKTLL